MPNVNTLKYWRVMRGLSGAALAKKADLSIVTIRFHESGRRKLMIGDTLKNLAAALNVHESSLQADEIFLNDQKLEDFEFQMLKLRTPKKAREIKKNPDNAINPIDRANQFLQRKAPLTERKN